jgi:ceramide glucosyltransferase
MFWLAGAAELIACLGVAQAVAGSWAVRGFRRRGEHAAAPAERPPVSVLKPLYGDEPLLEQALASFCAQRYGAYQIVFGVQRADDPALAVVRRVRARHPGCDVSVVVDATPHGGNGKVANLINMLPAARYDVLVVSDSDVHAPPDYLDRVAAALAEPGRGLVTSLYAALPANRSLAARLGATWITHGFLPGVLLARWLGRQDCLGATMALRRETLAAIGGFAALAGGLADDHALGLLVAGQGLTVGLADTVPATTVPEATLADLIRHELRWHRTVLALEPLGYGLSAVQFPLFWALLALLASGGQSWAWAAFAAAWAARAIAARVVDRTLGLAKSGLAASAPIWLLPLRDLLSMFVMLASYASDRVEWRGAILSAARPAQTAPSSPATSASPAGAA